MNKSNGVTEGSLCYGLNTETPSAYTSIDLLNLNAATCVCILNTSEIRLCDRGGSSSASGYFSRRKLNWLFDGIARAGRWFFTVRLAFGGVCDTCLDVFVGFGSWLLLFHASPFHSKSAEDR